MSTRKVVINVDYGGFGLSEEAKELYAQRKGIDVNSVWLDDFSRDDADLIEIVEQLGVQKAGSRYSALKIVEIPSDVEWIIQDYDGCEWIAEKHRTWG